MNEWIVTAKTHRRRTGRATGTPLPHSTPVRAASLVAKRDSQTLHARTGSLGVRGTRAITHQTPPLLLRVFPSMPHRRSALGPLWAYAPPISRHPRHAKRPGGDAPSPLSFVDTGLHACAATARGQTPHLVLVGGVLALAPVDDVSPNSCSASPPMFPTGVTSIDRFAARASRA